MKDRGGRVCRNGLAVSLVDAGRCALLSAWFSLLKVAVTGMLGCAGGVCC
ncbi:hypothetical protein [Corynebacterium mustelae]|nr:hypothetical protein [Corynebacterium mustelae]